MESPSSTCTNNRKLVASASGTGILGAASVLILLSIYLLSIVTNRGKDDAFAQQYTVPPHTSYSSLIHKTNNSITNNNILSDAGTVKPDKVTLVLGVQTTNKTAKAALRLVNEIEHNKKKK